MAGYDSFNTPNEIEFNQFLAKKLAEGSMTAPVGESGNVKAVSPFAPLSMMMSALAGKQLSTNAGNLERANVSKGQEQLMNLPLPGVGVSGNEMISHGDGGRMSRLPALSPLGSPSGHAMGYAEALKPGESGGKYHAIGPTTSDGDHAYGAYQVKGENIGPWTEKWLGVRLTPQQFLASQEAQDHVARMQMQEYVSKYGPEGAGRAWYGGEGNVANPNARDRANPHAPNVGEYGRRYMAQLGGQQALPFSGEPAAGGAPAGDAGAMVSALAGRGGAAGGEGAVAGVGGAAPGLPPGHLPMDVLTQRQMVPPQAAASLLFNPSTPDWMKQHIYPSYLQQFQPQTFDTPYGKLLYNPVTGHQVPIYDVHTMKWTGPEGTSGEVPYTYRPTPDGGVKVVPAERPASKAPAPSAAPGSDRFDLTPHASPPTLGAKDKPPAVPGPATPAAPAGGGKGFGAGAAPMPYPAVAPAGKALPFSGEPAGEVGAGEAPPEITKGPEAAKAEKAGGMLKVAPPKIGGPEGKASAFADTEVPTGAESPAGSEEFDPWNPASAARWGQKYKIDTESGKAFATKDVEDYSKAYGEISKKAESAANLRSQLGLTWQLINDKNFIGGPGASLKMPLNRALSFLGSEKATQRESIMNTFEKLRASGVLDAMRSALQGLGQVRLAEIALLDAAAPSKFNTVGANRAVIDIAMRTQAQMQDLGKVARMYRQGYRWNEDGTQVLDAKGNPMKFTGERPTKAGQDEAINTYLRNNPLFKPEEISEYMKTFAADGSEAGRRARVIEELNKRGGYRGGSEVK